MLCAASFGKIIHLWLAWDKSVNITFRLSDNARAREALRQCLPEPLRDATFSSVLRDDAATKRCLAQLLINLSDNVADPNTGVHMP
jgi:CCR4-NOT transcription complex subunit 9